MALALNPDIYRAVLECLPIGVYLVDRKRQISFWNKSAERITGYLGQEVIGRFCHDNLLMHCDENQVALCGDGCPLAHSMLDGRPRHADVFLRHKEGQRVPVWVRAVPIRDEFGAIIGSAEFFEERTFQPAETRPQSALDGDALDGTTGLPNDQAMLRAVKTSIDEWDAAQKPFGVLCMAIDNLDHLRQFDGPQAIREILCAAAKTVAASVRPSDTVGRWQADRFAALIACPAAAGLLSCAERVQRMIGMAAVPWWGERLSATVSMGGTMVRAGDTPDSIMRRAEQMLETSMAEQSNSILVV